MYNDVTFYPKKLVLNRIYPMETPKDNKNKSKKTKKDNGFMSKLWSVFFILLALIALYSIFTEDRVVAEEVTLSELATKIKAGEVTNILVEGEKLIVTLNDTDSTEIKSKKERESSLTETLANYGVTPEDLGKANIEIKNETGFMFWIGNLLPFLIPVLCIVLFF